MSCAQSDLARIAAEYKRRARDVSDDFYSLARPANLMMREQTVRACIRMLCRSSMFPLRNRAVLDIGCGFGGWLLDFIQWGANPAVSGIDLDAERVVSARLRLPQADIRIGTASELPWKNDSFDLVSQFTVFTSMLDPSLKQSVAREMLRVLRPGGAILWFDFRIGNPRNPHVLGIRASEIHALFPGCVIDLRGALLAPPISRLIAWSWPLAEILYSQPYLRTHYAGLIRKI